MRHPAAAVDVREQPDAQATESGGKADTPIVCRVTIN